MGQLSPSEFQIKGMAKLKAFLGHYSSLKRWFKDLTMIGNINEFMTSFKKEDADISMEFSVQSSAYSCTVILTGLRNRVNSKMKQIEKKINDSKR